LPLLASVSIFSPVGGMLIKKFKPHIPVFAGVLLMFLGFTSICFYDPSNKIFLSLSLSLIGIGIGLTSASLSTTATTSVPHTDIGVASSFLNLVRNLAGVFFVSAISILLHLDFSYTFLFVFCSVAIALTLFPLYNLKKAHI
jgi:MFS family permease